MSQDIELRRITADPGQPRKHFDERRLDELAQSMQVNGLAVPILVRPAGDSFIIVHGERRYRAAGRLGWTTIPAEVREISPDDAQWLALIENVQRADLSPIEEARAFRLHLDTGITQSELGKRIGKDQSYIAQKLRLLTLPEPIMLLLDRKAITEGHARQLLRLRAMYHDMTCSFEPDTVWHIGAIREGTNDPALLSDAQEIMFLYLALRLEDSPACGLMPATPTEEKLLRDVCNSFGAYVVNNQQTIPLWALAAFWWGSLVVNQDLSVVDLSRIIDGWHERFLSAIYWKYVFHAESRIAEDHIPFEQRSPLAKMQWLEYWAVNADLRHGRVSLYTQNNKLPSALIQEVLAHAKKHDLGYILPTQLQPGGAHCEQYQELARQLAAR